MTATGVRPAPDAATSLRRAWWSLLGFVVTFFLAFAVGEGLASALGHPTGSAETAEWWVMVLAGVPALVVFALPAVLAVHYGRRAVRLGESRGRYPIVVALVVAGGFVLLNLLSGILVLLAG
ncbi:hypothetical protein [uncultured Nocardioides sp.]|uniref:hypothetical protein n=1 Tax=uncultured Nocardioides sp. TaxID=198441 RepID=UPI002614ED9C|nr:hypothetical protein [uncultured Nocardioides sp.]